jgi:microcystin degradation protein MlrC
MTGPSGPETRPRRPAPRLALGGLAHETNTFNPVPTGLAAFRERALLQGEALLDQARGAPNALGGVVAATADAGFALLPTLFAAASPGGVVAAQAHRALRDALLDRLRTAACAPWPPGGLAGVVLVLHGAMVAEDEPDVDGALARHVRAVVGPGTPVVAIVDSHANVPPRLVESTDAVLSYATYPHVDTVETGRRAVELLLDLRAGLIQPATALRRVPLLAPLPTQRTTGPTPLAELQALTAELMSRREVVDAAVCGGFPYADTARTGLSVRVTTDGAPALANELADRLAAAVWSRRERFRAELPGAEAAVALALARTPAGDGPVILAETADNPGAGAPGDGTRLLAALLDRRAEGAVLAPLADPAAVAAAVATGRGATVTLPLGGRGHPLGGPPVERAWRVRAISDGTFRNEGPLGAGRTTRLGRTVVLAADGVEVVVCERRVQALEPALLRLVGIEPTARRLLALKSSVHFRAAFEGLAATVIEVGGPGLSGPDLASFPYRHVRRPILPLDREVRYLD